MTEQLEAWQQVSIFCVRLLYREWARPDIGGYSEHNVTINVPISPGLSGVLKHSE